MVHRHLQQRKNIHAYLSAYNLKMYFFLNPADVTCSHPGLVPHAEIQGNPGPFPVPVNTVLHYICEPCHHGDGTMTCQSNGQWSQRPDCIRMYWYFLI